MNRTVRMAVDEDADQILMLASALATSFEIEETGFRRVFTSMLKQDHIYSAVVEDEQKIIGYVLAGSRPCFYASGEVAWVEEIFIDEKFRGLALGRKLMDAVEEWAINRKCRLVSLATRRAAPFYLALGYEDSATYFKKTLDYGH